MDGSAAASFSPIVEKIWIHQIRFLQVGQGEGTVVSLGGPMPWCVNGFIALLSKFQYAQVFLNSVNIQEKYVALDFLRCEVTSFVALLYSCHNLGLLDEMACLSNLYLRFL